jgi:formylglycine-generating enzyme required for sulfatase activity
MKARSRRAAIALLVAASAAAFAHVLSSRRAAAAKAAAEQAAADMAAGWKVEPRSGLEFVYLPGGTFHLGCEPQDTRCEPDERPGRPVTVAALWMGRTDVTVAAYGRCVATGACSKPKSPEGATECNWAAKGREQHPINCIDWSQAMSFCRWIGGALPTAAEWEFAAKGGESRTYPWGEAPLDPRRANFCDRQCLSVHHEWQAADVSREADDGWAGTSPVGSYPEGATKQGLLDMAGDVWQWTSSDYDSRMKEIRGGSWAVAKLMRASFRGSVVASSASPVIGLRCRL